MVLVKTIANVLVTLSPETSLKCSREDQPERTRVRFPTLRENRDLAAAG